MAEKKTGAGLHLASVLERATQPKPVAPPEPDETDVPAVDDEPVAEVSKGRGSAPIRTKALAARQAKRIKARTIYMPDDLYERVMIAAHRRELNISEYVTAILSRHVPDHLRGRSEGDAA
jgi:hypothetical protein